MKLTDQDIKALWDLHVKTVPPTDSEIQAYTAAANELYHTKLVAVGRVLKKMATEGMREGWYVNHPEFYLDLEKEEDGSWSVLVRDALSGKTTVTKVDQT